MTVVGVDLGECGQFLRGSDRCVGRVVSVREVGGIVEAECSLCGDGSAIPQAGFEKFRQQPDHVRDESWYQKF